MTHIIRSIAQLEALYDKPGAKMLEKELAALSREQCDFIAGSPFVMLASVGPDGVDCSPRGEHAGFVLVQDEHTLLLPDRPGNNRIDSLRNIVQDGRVALLFMITGVGATLRVNGRAVISVDPALLQRCSSGGERTGSVLVIHVEAAYFHCPRALTRADLWAGCTPPVWEG